MGRAELFSQLPSGFLHTEYSLASPPRRSGSNHGFIRLSLIICPLTLCANRRAARGTAVVMEQQRTQDNLIRREARSKKMISMISASTATPQNRISTTELLASMMHKLSPELINTICTLGVENGYSAMDNYADFLTGVPMNATSSTTEVAVNATCKSIEQIGCSPCSHGFV